MSASSATPPEPASVGRPRPAVAAMPRYRPGRDASQADVDADVGEAVKLASNENPWPPPEPVRRAVAVAAEGANRYPDHLATELRADLARHLGVDPSSVAVGAGSTGLIQQLVAAYVDPGDGIVYPWRSFEAYPVFAGLAGAAVTTVELVDHTVDVDAVAAAVTPSTRLVFIANPNNPTGTAVDTAALTRLCAAVTERVGHDTLVVVDEAYREFCDPALGDPVTDLVPHFPQVVVLRTFSKAHGLAGLRVGYAIAHPEVVATLDATLAPFVVSAPAQAGARAALGCLDEIGAAVARLVAERERMRSALVEAGFTVPPSQANFVWLPLGERTGEVYTHLERRGLVTRPFADEGVRITVADPATGDRVIEALGSWIRTAGGGAAP